MKATTGGQERQQQKRKWTIFLFLSFLTDFAVVLHFASALVTTGRMKRYLQPIQVAQVVRLLQDGTSYVSSHGLLPAQSQEHGEDARRQAITQGEMDKAVEVQQPSSRTGICSFVRGAGGALPVPYKITPSGLLVCMLLTKFRNGLGGMIARRPLVQWLFIKILRLQLWLEQKPAYTVVPQDRVCSSGTCTHSPAPCNSVGICQRTPELAVLFTVESMFTISTWQTWKSGDAVGNVMLPATSSSMTGLAVGQWWSGEAYPWSVAQTSTC